MADSIPKIMELYQLLEHDNSSKSKASNKVSKAFRKDTREHWLDYWKSRSASGRSHLDTMIWATNKDELEDIATRFLDTDGRAEKYWPPPSPLHGQREKLIKLLMQLFFRESQNRQLRKSTKPKDPKVLIDLVESDTEREPSRQPSTSNGNKGTPPGAGHVQDRANNQASEIERLAAAAVASSRDTDEYDIPDSPVRENRQKALGQPAVDRAEPASTNPGTHSVSLPSPQSLKRSAPSGDATEQGRKKLQKPTHPALFKSKRGGHGARIGPNGLVFGDRGRRQTMRRSSPEPTTARHPREPQAGYLAETEESPSKVVAEPPPLRSNATVQAPVAAMLPLQEPERQPNPKDGAQSHESPSHKAADASSAALISPRLLIVRSREPMLCTLSWTPSRDFNRLSLAELMAETPFRKKFASAELMFTLAASDLPVMIEEVKPGEEAAFEELKTKFTKRALEDERRCRGLQTLTFGIWVERKDTWQKGVENEGD